MRYKEVLYANRVGAGVGVEVGQKLEGTSLLPWWQDRGLPGQEEENKMEDRGEPGEPGRRGARGELVGRKGYGWAPGSGD